MRDEIAARVTTIVTERLELVPATPDLIRAALTDAPALGDGLGVRIPESWPPELLDRGALEYTLARLARGSEQEGWWLYFMVLPGAEERVVVGVSGYKGPPTPDGTVEVGYGVLPEYRRRGFASETVRAMVVRAFAIPAVRRVIAETYPELVASIGVLRTCGFRDAEEGSEPGVIRFELERSGA